MKLYCPWIETFDEKLIFCGIYEDRKSAHAGIIKVFNSIEHDENHLSHLHKYRCSTVCYGLSAFLPLELNRIVSEYLAEDDPLKRYIIMYLGDDYKSFKTVLKKYFAKVKIFVCSKNEFHQQTFTL